MRTGLANALSLIALSAGLMSSNAADAPKIVRVTDLLNAAHYPSFIVTIEFADAKWNGSDSRQWGDWSVHGETLTGAFHKGDGTKSDPDSASIDGLHCLSKGPESARGSFSCSIVLYASAGKNICGILAMESSNLSIAIACPTALSLIKM